MKLFSMVSLELFSFSMISLFLSAKEALRIIYHLIIFLSIAVGLHQSGKVLL